ncbi:hypothetical protein C8A03DRAFT_32766 [Achaetomium macrosporum]|uniref:Uncharacterized protein n=1 Tax=Achaetomium macrosporum TaxID=79813 RepID=A0AAN7CBT2_9PEZI|nr:hypothetical protein C8A03DRAFT_32766 [Achaetomium macrosporum]
MATFIPGWNQKPFSTITLSAGGLLAIADLQTIAQRTALTGGASWMDSLVLAPGIQYQAAADELFWKGAAASIVDVVDEHGGAAVSLKLTNAATWHYIQRVAKPGETVTLNVGRAVAAHGASYMLRRTDSGDHAMAWRVGRKPDLGFVSHVLYLISPVLTLAAIGFIVIFKDWWGLVSIMGLMTSRILNIWVIKQRASHSEEHQNEAPKTNTIFGRSRSKSRKEKRPTHALRSPHRHRFSFTKTRERVCQYLVRLDNIESKTLVRLRGKASDLRAITSQKWLRSKTHLESYLEGAAKLIVYLVGALSGNMTQVGAMIMMALLLVSAGLLALSNAKAKTLTVNGREVAPVDENGNAPFSPSSPGPAGSPAAGTGGGSSGSPLSNEVRRADVPVDPRSDQDRGRPRQGPGGLTGVVGMSATRAGAGTAEQSRGVRGGEGNPADLAERGRAGFVRRQN